MLDLKLLSDLNRRLEKYYACDILIKFEESQFDLENSPPKLTVYKFKNGKLVGQICNWNIRDIVALLNNKEYDKC